MSTLPFNSHNLVYAPSEHGVYFLYAATGVLIYIGRAAGNGVTIYSRLSSHLRGAEGPCTAGATHFGYEVTPYPITREEELLKAYKQQSGGLPRCNDRIG